MSISKKFLSALVGDLFHETVGTSVNHSARPRVLLFQGLATETRQYPNGQTYSRAIVLFKTRAGEEVKGDADDRYGYFPKLDAKQVAKLQARQQQLMDELATYNFLLEQVR